MRFSARRLAVLVALIVCGVTPAQNTYTYSTTSTNNQWTTTTNWSGGASNTYSGDPTNNTNSSGATTDRAVINNYNFSGGLGLNMTTMGGGVSLASIDYNPTTSGALQIGNSSTTTNGTLRLNGGTVNSVANTLIAVRGSSDLTVANTQAGSGTRTMALQLGITNGIFNVSTGRVLTISSNITQTSTNAGAGFTLTGGGRLVLSGTNNYNGAVTISNGTLWQNGSMTRNGTVTVGSSGVLGGTGSHDSDTTVNSGGVIAPGTTGAGTLGIHANVTLNNGSTLRMDVGGTSDLLDMSDSTHNLFLNSGTTINLVGTGSFANGTEIILADLNGVGNSRLQLDGAGVAPGTDITRLTNSGQTNLTGTTVNVTLTGFTLNSGQQLMLRRNATGDLVATFSPVPEPGSILAVCGLVAGGVAGWRRWRAKPAESAAAL